MAPDSVFGIDIFWVYFIYGLAFFCMGLALAIESSRAPNLAEAKVLLPLAVFGFVHGIHEWLEMTLLKTDWFISPASLSWLRLAILTISFTSLLVFALLALRPWGQFSTRAITLAALALLVYLGCMLLVSLGLRQSQLDWSQHAETMVRYTLAIPAALLAALALYLQSRRSRSQGRPGLASSLLVAAICFIVYAFTQAVVAPAGGFPANYLNALSFASITGFPVQLLRAALAVLITFSMLRATQILEREREQELQAAQTARLQALEQMRQEMSARAAMRQELLRRTVLAQEEERSRIARELHDDTAQLLTAFSYNLAALKESVPNSPKTNELVARLQALRQQMSQGIYRMVHDLRPAQLDDLGLVAALHALTEEDQKRLGLQVKMQVAGTPQRLDPLAETVLFRVAQEALTNVARHAQVKGAELQLSFTPAQVVLRVQDHGIGMYGTEQNHLDRGVGLATMRERAESVGGELTIAAAPGAGTEIKLVVPIASEADLSGKEKGNGSNPDHVGG